MKKTRFKESQIVGILKQYDAGKTSDAICREQKISKATFYNWRKKYNGMDTQQLRKLKELEDENKRLKRMFADLSLDHQLLKEVLEKKF
jgi:putative transposase